MEESTDSSHESNLPDQATSNADAPSNQPADKKGFVSARPVEMCRAVVVDGRGASKPKLPTLSRPSCTGNAADVPASLGFIGVGSCFGWLLLLLA